MKRIGLWVRLHVAALYVASAVAADDAERVFEPIEVSSVGVTEQALVDCPDIFEAPLVSNFDIDGAFTNALWQNAAPITEFRNRSPDKKMSVKSEVRVMHSDWAFYVGGVFYQPMDKMHVQYDQHDMPVYDDDCFEMFWFVPNRDGSSDLVHWAVNPIGVVTDLRNGKKSFETQHLIVKTRQYADRWTFEMRFPFSSVHMQLPLPGDFVGCRFCRSVFDPRTCGTIPYLKKFGNDQRGNFGKLLFAEPRKGFPAAARARLEKRRAERESKMLQKRLEEIEAKVTEQESALVFWRDSDHPAVERARRGVAQMRRALEAFKKDRRDPKGLMDLGAGFDKFVSENAYIVWRTSPWETGSARERPPKEGWEVSSISFSQAVNEREQVCLVFAGLLCGARYDLRLVPRGFSTYWKDGRFVSCDQFEVYEEPYIRVEKDVLTVPLIRKDGNIVTLTPGHPSRVWVIFNSRGVRPGSYNLAIDLKGASDISVAQRKLEVNVDIWDFALPETRDWPIKTFFWGQGMFQCDEVQILRKVHDYHVTHGWTKMSLYRYGVTNEQDFVEYMKATGRAKLKPGEVDYNPVLARTANEDFFRVARELGMRFVIGWDTPNDPSWFRTLHDRFSKMGFKPEDYVFKGLIRDEFRKKDIPSRAKYRAAVDADRRKFGWWFQAVYLSVPPPEGATIDDIEAAGLPEFYKMWTVIRPLTKKPVVGPDVIQRLRSKGCSVWTYECNYYLQRQDILTYCRFYPMEAYEMNLDGAAVWCVGGRVGDDGFDASDGYDDGIMWMGNERKLTTTKRFEAFREGLEDVAYLDRLKKEVSRLKAAGRDVARAESLVDGPARFMKSPSQQAVDEWRTAVGAEIDRLTKIK